MYIGSHVGVVFGPFGCGIVFYGVWQDGNHYVLFWVCVLSGDI